MTFHRWYIPAGVAVFVYIALGAVFCNATLHVPRLQHATPKNAEEVRIEAPDHTRLAAWWFPGRSGERCVAVLHGIADSRGGSTPFASMFLRHGYSVLTPDSRGHGESSGEFITYGLLEKGDALAWAAWMRARGCRKVYGLGESLGGSILIQAAERPGFDAIVADSAFADLREVAEYRVSKLAPVAGWVTAKAVVSSATLWARIVDGFDLTRVSPVVSPKTGSVPTLLIHGLADDRTPPENSRELARAIPGSELWLVPGAGHVGSWGVAGEEFEKRVVGWFDAH